MPQGLTVNGNNRLFVIDSLTGKILVYDTISGDRLGKVRKSGHLKGKYHTRMPLDILIDDNTSDIFVTNTKLASILVFAGAGGI